MSAAKKCVFCCGNADPEIILFKEVTLSKCVDILKVPVAYNLKYKETVLPATPDKINGYHLNCYRSFTALKQKYIEQYNALLKSQQSSNSTLESETLSSIHG